MKAAYLLDKQIHVGEVPDPVPGDGLVLVKTHACGLCASDAHLLQHADRLVAWSKEAGGPFNMDLSRPVVMGHEYVGEIVDYGPRTKRHLKVGTRVTSLPAVFRPDTIMAVGISNEFPGGFGEYMLLDEQLLLAVPESLDADLAAMTEPLAVGLHHARFGRVGKDDVPLVVGCGAIGLGVIAGLRLLGVSPIVAADFAVTRRELAVKMGADLVVDPREMSPYQALPGLGSRRPTVVFECVGVPGLLDQIMRAVGHGTRIVVGGWCLEMDQLFTPCPHFKQITIQFAGGEEPQDLVLALSAISDGRIDIAPWLGTRIGLTGVGEALKAMADPTNPIRTVVDPRRM